MAKAGAATPSLPRIEMNVSPGGRYVFKKNIFMLTKKSGTIFLRNDIRYERVVCVKIYRYSQNCVPSDVTFINLKKI